MVRLGAFCERQDAKWGNLMGGKGKHASQQILSYVKKERLPFSGQPFLLHSRLLLQTDRDLAELRVQVRADRLNDRDDCDSDAGGDQTIFDGRGARFIGQKARKKFLHESLHLQVTPDRSPRCPLGPLFVNSLDPSCAGLTAGEEGNTRATRTAA